MSEANLKNKPRKLPATYQVDYRETYFKGIKLVMYLWVIRSACLAISSGMSGFLQLFDNWSHDTIIRIKTLETFHWNTIVLDGYVNLPLNNNELNSSEPKLYENVPIISNALLISKFHKLIPLLDMKLKISSNNFFNYYDLDRIWSNIYSNLSSYDSISIKDYISSSINQNESILSYLNPLKEAFVDRNFTCTNSNINECNNNNPIIKDKYIYGTYPNISPYLSGLAPGLSQYLAIESDNKLSKVSLWLSSCNITTSLHYDHDDNLLLQIDGIKKVTIISPEAINIFNPYSSYHPYLRQTSKHELINTSNELFRYIERVVMNNYSIIEDKDIDKDIINWKAYKDNSTDTHENKFIKKKSLYNNYTSNKYKNDLIIKQLINNKYGEIKIYQTILKPGDMLYIPAGYYHLITTLSESISINAWFPSQFSHIYLQLLNIILPYDVKDMNISLDKKISQFIFVIQNIMNQLNISIELLIDLLLSRYKILLVDNNIDDNEQESSYCTLETWNYLNQSKFLLCILYTFYSIYILYMYKLYI